MVSNYAFLKLFLFRLLSLRLVKTAIDELENKIWKGYVRTSREEVKERLNMLIHG